MAARSVERFIMRYTAHQSLCGFLFVHFLSRVLSGMVFVPSTINHTVDGADDKRESAFGARSPIDASNGSSSFASVARVTAECAVGGNGVSN